MISPIIVRIETYDKEVAISVIGGAKNILVHAVVDTFKGSVTTT